MLISIPCSKKVFNVWYFILIVAAFCCKFPGPLLGVLGLIFFILIKFVESICLKKNTKLSIEKGIFPIETVYAISLALNEKIKHMDLAAFESFKSQYNFFKATIKNYFPDIFKDECKEFSFEEIKPVIQYIEKQIAFIKNNMTESSSDILNVQLDVYFILLVFYYSKFYKDVKSVSKELFKKLNK